MLLERTIFQFVDAFWLFPHRKGCGASFEKKIQSLSSKDLCAKFGWNWPSGCENENVKFTDRRTDRKTDRQRDWRTTGDQKSFVEISAHLCWNWIKMYRIDSRTIHFYRPSCQTAITLLFSGWTKRMLPLNTVSKCICTCLLFSIYCSSFSNKFSISIRSWLN